MKRLHKPKSHNRHIYRKYTRLKNTMLSSHVWLNIIFLQSCHDSKTLYNNYLVSVYSVGTISLHKVDPMKTERHLAAKCLIWFLYVWHHSRNFCRILELKTNISKTSSMFSGVRWSFVIWLDSSFKHSHSGGWHQSGQWAAPLEHQGDWRLAQGHLDSSCSKRKQLYLVTPA